MKVKSSDPSLRALVFGGTVLIIAAALMLCFLIGTTSAMAGTPKGGQVSLHIAIYKEVRTAAADGATDVKLVAADKAAPGDRLVYVLTYRNTGAQPVSNLILDYPMPKGVSYRSPAQGSQPPLVSADGVHFGPPADMAGGSHPGLSPRNGTDAVTALRWQVDGPVAPGAQGEVSFKATLD